MTFKLVFSALTAYLLGNISPSIMLSRLKGRDIRTSGSGNAGSTNMLRTYGLGLALLTLAGDVLKGVLAVVIGRLAAGESGAYISALCVILGHIWPAFWGFKGGKGIASALGALLAVSFPLGLSCLALALLVMALSGMVSPGSLAGCLAMPLASLCFAPGFLPYALLMAAVMIFKHRENIKRLLRGEESKISFKKEGRK